jgi:Helix-turn-helix domain
VKNWNVLHGLDRICAAPNISSTDAHVLMVIAVYSNKAGEAYPSLPTIAKAAKLTRRTATRSVQRLQQVEIPGLRLTVSKRPSKSGGQPHNVYHLALVGDQAKVSHDHVGEGINVTGDHVAKASNVSDDHVVDGSNVTKDHVATCQAIPLQRDTGSPDLPKGSTQGSTKTSEEASDSTPPLLPLVLMPVVGGTDVELAWAAYIAGWRTHVGHGSAPKLNDSRRRMIRARLKSYPVADLVKAAENLWASLWHRKNGRTQPELAWRKDAKLEAMRDGRPESSNGPRVQSSGMSPDEIDALVPKVGGAS